MTDILSYLALVLIGGAAGFINILAGGGSLLTLPFLIFLGLPPTVANGTNRIAILVQNISATWRFQRFKVIPKEVTWVTTVPAVFGALIGAQIAVQIDELLFKRLLAVVIVAVMGFIFFGPGQETTGPSPKFTNTSRAALGVVFFFIGIYGGFIQGGIGFLLITALTLAGYDLVRVNALKVLVVLVFTPFALAIFIAHGQVDYLRGLALACGNAGGAWLATKVAVDRGHAFLRWLVMAAALLFAVKLLFA